MAKQLLLHPSTDIKIKIFIDRPRHALLITGERGSGKAAVAKFIVTEVLKITGELDDYGYFYHLNSADGKEIPIESVRQLINKLKLKTPGKASIKRAVVIEDANQLSGEAQSALLKTLEEPPLDTVFILTAVSERQILPTIASRTYKLNVSPVRFSDAHKYFTGHASEAELTSNWKLARGNAGLLVSLIDGASEHPLKQAVENSKEFLRQNKYERLRFLDKIAPNQNDLNLFLDGLARVLGVLETAAIEKNQANAKKIQQARKVVNKQLNQAGNRVNIKLTKLHLIMDLAI